MPELQNWAGVGSATRVGIVSTYPPTRCGIARFTFSLCASLRAVDSTLTLGVLRLVDDRSPGRDPTGLVRMEIDPSRALSIRAAAQELNRCDVAIINHEFGIFGPNDGANVVDLAHLVDVPTLSILHTVLPEPSPEKEAILKGLCAASTPVVLSETAGKLLVRQYAVAESMVTTIPHGADWDAQPVNQPPRRQLVTWGLLGPGKGLERSIAATAELKDMNPPVHYRIVGRTHPNVVRRSGRAYLDSLQRLAARLGVDDRVEFVGRYVDETELFQLVRASDLVVVPYDNRDQVTSGVLTEAVGAGRPVVATRFLHAQELLASGAGIVVDHDVSAMARAIRALLEDSAAYDRAACAAARVSTGLSWDTVGGRYAALIRRLAPAKATA